MESDFQFLVDMITLGIQDDQSKKAKCATINSRSGTQSQTKTRTMSAKFEVRLTCVCCNYAEKNFRKA
jgi:hypothetical protein